MNKLLLSLAIGLTMGTAAIGQTKNFIDQPYIEVSGYADTLVTPNLIYIQITIAEKDNRDKISLEEQESKMVNALKNLGIKTEVDLATSDMLSNYKFHLLKQKDILKTKQYVLTVTTAELASRVFLQLEDLGISNTSIISTDHSELAHLENICRIKAIQNSQQKAIALTKPIGQTIGHAIHISDNESDIGQQLRGMLAGVQIRGVNSIDKGKWEPPKVEFEKIKVSAKVSVTYVLK